MIKSVKFKPGTAGLQFEGKVIREGDLSPSLYLKLVGINPRFSEAFEVTFEEEQKQIETENTTDNGEENTGTGSGRTRAARNPK